MKKQMNVAVGIFFMNAILLGGNITYETAEIAAKNWYSFVTERQETVNNVIVETLENDTTLYLFNFVADGFVLISADSSIKPVLGYSESGEITEDRPPAFQWLWIPIVNRYYGLSLIILKMKTMLLSVKTYYQIIPHTILVGMLMD